MGNKVYVSGVGFECEAKVIAWFEEPYFDSANQRCHYKTKKCPDGILPFSNKSNINKSASRMARRPPLRRYGMNPPLSAVQSVVKKFVIHHDGVSSAATCFHVLHNERGLSCHFLIDNNGDIYQTLDLGLMGFHAAIFNIDSVGVELCNRGDAKKYPGYYEQRGMSRDVATCRIRNHTYLAYDYTKEQYTAMRHLAKTLTRALPNLPLDYPQDTPGHAIWRDMPFSETRNYAGYIGHYHLTSAKWDPGPFDFKEFCTGARGSLCFPVFARKTPDNDFDRPEVPSYQEDLRADADALHKKNENTMSGFFPVGPFGDSRLWHGGVHIQGKYKSKIYAPFPGRIVAARQGADTSSGSVNFVLMRHKLNVGKQSIEFFSLYYHLFYEKEEDEGMPEWMTGAVWQEKKRPASVVLLDEPIEAGHVIARMGRGGPMAVRKEQMHFEIFAADEVMEELKAGVWTVFDGSSSGRFCQIDELNKQIDRNSDGKLAKQELSEFYTMNSQREVVRFYVTLNVSEWVAEPDWLEELKLAPDYEDLDEDKLEEMVQDQITPTLWWDDRVADHCKLPEDGVVYHYNPISFIKYVNERLLEANALAADGKNAYDVSEASETPDDVTDDGDDADATGMFAADILEEEDRREDLDLADLVKGFESK